MIMIIIIKSCLNDNDYHYCIAFGDLVIITNSGKLLGKKIFSTTLVIITNSEKLLGKKIFFYYFSYNY